MSWVHTFDTAENTVYPVYPLINFFGKVISRWLVEINRINEAQADELTEMFFVNSRASQESAN